MTTFLTPQQRADRTAATVTAAVAAGRSWPGGPMLPAGR